MNIIRKTLLGILIISLITFIALFGRLPALRRTPIGWLQRALCLHLPNGLKAVDQTVTGGVLSKKGRKLGQYLFFEKNPLVLILFLSILTASATLFLHHGAHRLPTALLIPSPILLALPCIFTYLSATHTAHRLTTETKHPHSYPYDHILYRPLQSCRTCAIPKPARSKHCSLCNICISKLDHHCPWVNNCLGQGNYRWFLLLLLSLSVLEFYGTFLAWYILRPYLQTPTGPSFFSVEHFRHLGDAAVRAVNAGGLSIAGVGMLAASTAFLPLGLFAYHAYLIWAGMTTNESQKWADWRDDMADGLVFVSSRAAIRAHCIKQQEAVASGSRDTGVCADVTLGSALGLLAGAQDDPDVEWPVDSDQIVVRTNNGKPPKGQEVLWRRIWTLAEVENVYDLGGWDNFWDVVMGR
ncbi:hypothetical protein Q7P37_000993 [Cladosporium fusiforme]